MIYDVDYFINKFEAIPEQNWCVGSRAELGYQRCAVGWCYPSYEQAQESSYMYQENWCDEEKQLINLTVKYLNGLKPAVINNGIYTQYQQPTPKQRILAALYDIKKMQQPKKQETIPESKPKEIIRYVSVPESISEQLKELVNN